MSTQSTSPNDQLENERKQLVCLLHELTSEQGVTDTTIDELKLFRRDEPASITPVIYQPAFCVMVQGEKKIYIGDEGFRYTPLDFLLVPVMLPVAASILTASPQSPYLGLRIDINMRELTDLIIDTTNHEHTEERMLGMGVNVGKMDLPLLNAVHRMVQLTQHPTDIPIMLPLIRREILYRILQSKQGALLRDFTRLDSQSHRIASVIELIQQRYNEPLRIKKLADAVNLSESALFQAFKTVTAMSPLQFQKKLRLNEARRIMLHEGAEAATASYKVGYESPSQFSREYARLFGAPPKTDVARFRNSAM